MLIIDQKATREYQARSRFVVEKFIENFFNEFGTYCGSRQLEGIPVDRKVGESHEIKVTLEEDVLVTKPPAKAFVLRKGHTYSSVILPICGRAK